MQYRLTALTPLLVGDGKRLAPIDYMVWKDQINVLDQQRIFRLLSKGPRLDGYLAQLRKAEKLDFASWGGFAQNYAARRIPFEHPSSSAFWEAARAEQLFIPTFAAGPHGPYVPGTALKGALRTALAASRWNAGTVKELANRAAGERGLRRPGEAGEALTLGSGGSDLMRNVQVGDSGTVPLQGFRIYVMRTGALSERGGKLELAWKQAPRGYVGRSGDATPSFVEMAPARTSFSGVFGVASRSTNRREAGAGPERLLEAANDHATRLLDLHREWANRTGLTRLGANLDALAGAVKDARARRDSCVLHMGHAAGFLSKTAFTDTANEDLRKLLRNSPNYERAIRTGLPFPKTRRIVFEGGEPSTLPGWVLLELR
ncbi:MAG TPA: type III-A CRISPR-associated RAMP protein Csm5 [Bryobacteraceae bacterium]|nr:type III-A CRISPR-associated RAMP protein Csm5 [Bryobacteraceae bacterium]